MSALRRLASDADANVRVAALNGLRRVSPGTDDELYRAALAAEHPDLVRTAASLLEGRAPTDETVTALWAALERFSERGRETERDARLAVLDRLREFGDVSDSTRLAPYLTSYDAALAEGAATLLSAWTGRAQTAAPSPPARSPELEPTAERLRRLDGAHVELDMARGGTIRISLRVLSAPTNAIRFAHLVESGALNGRTLHRVVPGFVVQGGSWGANEYAGEPAYTRDEVGLSAHWRGTVGLSTRGRDTGDGQLFVNLVDNVRLDHDYTIFGEVVAGMDVVDAIMEGDEIAEARLIPRSGIPD